MILPCPNCKTRFLVDAAAIGQAGRQVRCGRCGESWYQPGLIVEAAEDVAEAVPEFVIRPRTPGANLPALRPQPRSGALAWVVLAVLVALAAGLVYYVAQGDIGGLWRNIASAIGGPPQPGQPSGPGAAASDLTIPPETIQTAQDGKTLVVTGVVVNRADQARDIPRLKLIFLNADKSRELGTKSFTASTPKADPKAAVKFEVRIDEIPAGAEHLRVTFEN